MCPGKDSILLFVIPSGENGPLGEGGKGVRFAGKNKSGGDPYQVGLRAPLCRRLLLRSGAPCSSGCPPCVLCHDTGACSTERKGLDLGTPCSFVISSPFLGFPTEVPSCCGDFGSDGVAAHQELSCKLTTWHQTRAQLGRRDGAGTVQAGLCVHIHFPPASHTGLRLGEAALGPKKQEERKSVFYPPPSP